MPDAAGRVEDALTHDERRLLRCGLREWGGPSKPTDDLARALGFRDLEDFDEARDRLQRALEEREALSADDWRRVLVATEVAFVSDVLGSGRDWSTTTGLSDAESIALLRGAQRKLSRLDPGSGVITADKHLQEPARRGREAQGPRLRAREDGRRLCPLSCAGGGAGRRDRRRRPRWSGTALASAHGTAASGS